jgi:hypothetical protein
MTDDVQHSIHPQPVAIAAIAATEDRKPHGPAIDSHFDAQLAKQRARNVLRNDRLHPTSMSLTRSSPLRRPTPCRATTPRRRVRHRDRQAATNDLLRAVADLDDELVLRIKKQRKLRNGAAKTTSGGLVLGVGVGVWEQRACCYDQSPSTPKGNMVVPLMDLVVHRQKGKLKSDVNGSIYSIFVTLIHRVSSSVRRVRSSIPT